MKRLTSMLAAGLLAAATVLATAGAASAGPTAAPRTTCSGGILTSIFVTQNTVQYFAGVPNNVSSGSTVRLKPSANGTTTWCFTQIPSGPNAGQFVVTSLNGGLALTSRSFSTGADVTVTTNGGFASQRWILDEPSSTTITLQNVKTSTPTAPKFLRIRNSGPIMGQTVTTGSTATDWTLGVA
jgi:hypothetical protein